MTRGFDMHAIIAFFLTPIGKYVGLALLVIVALGWYRFDAVQDGYNQATRAMNEQMLKWTGLADKARQKVTECPLDKKWNRSTGKCE
jgi:hypothetical protein